jgi:hypothetical protein
VPARVEAWKRQFADTTSRGVETSFGRLEHSVEAQMHKKLELLATHDDVKVHGVGLANATEIPFELPTDGAYVAVAVALAPIPLIAVGVSSSGEIQSGTDNKRPFASAKVAGAARSKFVFLIARASDEAMTAEQEAQLPDVACSVRIYRAKD